MSVSKLFTPKVRTKPCVLGREEEAPIFMNPPTHPEIPVYLGPTDNGGNPLHLNGASGKRTYSNQRRPTSTKPQEDTNY